MNRTAISQAARGASAAALTIMAALCLSAGQQTTRAADHKVKLDELIADTQKGSSDAGAMTYVWWVPNEYWQVALKDNPDVTPEYVRKLIEVVNAYTIIAAVDGKLGAFGNVAYKSEAEMRSSLSIVDGDGQTHYPLETSAIDAEAKSLIVVVKPVLANAMGPLGENMNFYLFPGKDKRGGRLLDPGKEGRFTVKMGGAEFKWRLPLGSLLPAKTCPKCGETLNGAYKFCPWDGSALAAGKNPDD